MMGVVACFIKLIFDYQTLIGSLLAVVAAFLTIREMRLQSQSNEDRHNDDRARKRLAARSQMPDALSELTGYVRAMTSHLIVGSAMPQPPSGGLNTLKYAIEHIDNEEAEKAFELVSWYQVLHARVTGSADPNPAEVNDRLVDAALLQAQIDRLFPYARNEGAPRKNFGLSHEEVVNGLKSSIPSNTWAHRRGDFQDVKNLIERRYK